MTADPDTVDALARELYEADALHNQQVVNFPIEHWDTTDLFTQDRWRNVARAALAFRPKDL